MESHHHSLGHTEVAFHASTVRTSINNPTALTALFDKQKETEKKKDYGTHQR
jgi:hypothetical protein